MNRLRHIALLALVAGVCSTLTTYAQNEIPTKVTNQNRSGELPFSSSVGTAVEHVDLATGTLNVRIPIVSIPGRGLNSELYYRFDSNYFLLAPRTDALGNPYYLWTIPVNSGWQTNHSGWTWASIRVHCDPGPNGQDEGFLTGTQNYIFSDSSGSKHPLAVQIEAGICAGPGDATGPDLTGQGMLASTSMAILADGTATVPDYRLTSPEAGSQTDSNGNSINNSFNVMTDTLGRTLYGAQTTSDGAGNPIQIKYTVTDSNGSPQLYTVNFKIIAISTNFGNSTNVHGPVHELSGGGMNVIDSVVLPNNQSYVFRYDEGGYGEITEIDLPTGGVVTYTYANLQNARKTRRYVASRTETVNGVASTWTFSIVPTYAIQSETDAYTSTVTYPAVGNPPVANQSVFLSGDGGISDAKIYAGSATGTPLREYQVNYAEDTDPYADDSCYDDTLFGPLQPQAVGQRVTRITTILDNGMQSKKEFDYETFTYVYHPNHCSNRPESQTATSYTTSRGNVIETREYDWGQGAPGPLIRRTDKTYLHNSNSNYVVQNIVDKVLQETIYDGSSNQKAQTQYEYDNYVAGQNALINTNSNPAAAHDYTNYSSSFIYRGNATRVKKWRNTDGAFLTTTYTYDDLGNIRAITDPLNNTTSYSYTDRWSDTSHCQPVGGNGQAYATLSTNALGQNVQFTYFPCTGITQARQDQNDINASRAGTTYLYDLLGRVTQKSNPDNGQVTTSYNDVPPVSTTTISKITPSQNLITTKISDDLGRPTQTQLTSDPNGTDYTVTTFDPIGRIYQVYNPTRCNPPTTNCGESTWRDITYGYDALGRTNSVTAQDGSVTTTSYSGNCTTTTDPAGKARKYCSDALGRRAQVFEDPFGRNYETDYQYDALDNLLCVAQKGTNSGTFSNCASTPLSWRLRSFRYDSLSRLLTASNPESGTVSYSYDNNGNAITKIDARGITTCFGDWNGTSCNGTTGYDALNRVLKKTSSDATPSASFTYDTASLDGHTLTNPIGHLVKNATADGKSATWNGYDQLGRISNQWQCSPLNCGATPYTKTFVYDFLGDHTSDTYSYTTGTLTISYSYDNAARPLQVTSSLVDSQHPATLATVDSSFGYWPTGALRKISFANGLTETTAYNNRLQPCRINVNSSGAYFNQCSDAAPNGTLQDFNYGYNFGSSDNGNVASWTATGQQTFSRSFAYDSLNRIATMQETNGDAEGCKPASSPSNPYTLSWTIDAWGNRTNQTPSIGTCSFSQVVDTNNRFIAPYQYNAAGNMTNDGSHSYTFDAENRVTQVDGGSTASYVYDADGRRVWKSVGGTTTDYLYDLSDNIFAIFGPGCTAGCWTAGAEYLNGHFFAEYANGTTYFVHKDHLGSSRLLTGLDQSVCDSYDYLPYGEQLTGGNCTILRFTGKEHDSESGLDNSVFRYFGSSMGRFMSADPSGIFLGNKADPQQLNLYAYARNNPLRFLDPLGLDCAYLNDAGTGAESIDHNSNIGECEQNGGYWANGSINQLSWVQPNVNNDTAVIYSQFANGGIGVSLASQTWTQGAFGLSDEASNSLYSFQQWTPLTWNDQALRAIAAAAPTVCGGGLFFYAGVQGKSDKIGTGGFLGYLGEWDSNSGYSHNGLAEVSGNHSAVGGVANKNGLDSLVFVPAGEYGGGVIGKSAVGLYAGTDEKFPVGIGVGGYLNITSNAGCTAMRSQHK